MAKNRMKSINETIKRELATIFNREINPFVSCLITITEVKTSADLHFAKVFYSVMGQEGDKEKVADAISRKSNEIQMELGSRLRIKFTPKIRWHYDTTPEDADNICKLIDSITYSTDKQDPQT